MLVPLTIGVHTGASAPLDSTEPADDFSAAPLPTLLPMASESERIDLGQPTFSNPTVVDNPLFPISNLHSAILLGNNEGHPIKIETTLLARPVMIDVDGQQIAALASQFVSYEDGRIHEVAIDWYAQDDDGNVWYLGEDVFNYADGVVEDTHGTWMAGRDGAPVAMIMPADPVGGEVFRPENIEGVLIEEVTISAVDVTVEGPTGPVEGAIIAQENHALDGVYEDKWFAPSYGEFFSGVGDSLEGIAVLGSHRRPRRTGTGSVDVDHRRCHRDRRRCSGGRLGHCDEHPRHAEWSVGGVPRSDRRAPDVGGADGPGARRARR